MALKSAAERADAVLVQKTVDHFKKWESGVAAEAAGGAEKAGGGSFSLPCLTPDLLMLLLLGVVEGST